MNSCTQRQYVLLNLLLKPLGNVAQICAIKMSKIL